MPTRLLPLVLAALLAHAGPARAWGPAAHEAVAAVAAQRLTPAVRKTVATLLAGDSMMDVAVWADDARNSTHPQTTPWHFANIPLSSQGFSRARDCRQGNCVVGAIERMEVVLRDRSRPRTARQEALKFLIHFVADVHQPMHAIDASDRGGNDRPIAPMGGSRNLHAAWDSGIIRSLNGHAGSLVSAARTWLASQPAAVAGGTPAAWANESHRLGRDIAYAQVSGDDAIAGRERLQALQIIEQQVARAGARLAALLNRALGVSTT